MKLEVFEYNNDIRIGFKDSEGYQANIILRSDFINSDFPKDTILQISHELVSLYNHKIEQNGIENEGFVQFG